MNPIRLAALALHPALALVLYEVLKLVNLALSIAAACVRLVTGGVNFASQLLHVVPRVVSVAAHLARFEADGLYGAAQLFLRLYEGRLWTVAIALALHSLLIALLSRPRAARRSYVLSSACAH